MRFLRCALIVLCFIGISFQASSAPFEITDDQYLWHYGSHKIEKSASGYVCVESNGIRLLARTSHDSQRWSKPLAITETLGDIDSYGLKFDLAYGFGKYILVWSSYNKIYQSLSVDGTEWSTPALIHQYTGINNDYSRLRIATVSYQQQDYCSTPRPEYWVIAYDEDFIPYVMESSNGANWSNPIAVAPNNPVKYAVADLACDDSHNWTLMVTGEGGPESDPDNIPEGIYIMRKEGIAASWTEVTPFIPSNAAFQTWNAHPHVASLPGNRWSAIWLGSDDVTPANFIEGITGQGSSYTGPITIVSPVQGPYLYFPDICSNGIDQYCLTYWDYSGQAWYKTFNESFYNPSILIPSMNTDWTENLQPISTINGDSFLVSWGKDLWTYGRLYCNTLSANVASITPGWSSFGQEDLTQAFTTFQPCSTQYRAHIVPMPVNVVERSSGWIQTDENKLPFSSIPSGWSVRGKFYMHHGGQDNMYNSAELPFLTMRLQVRWAMNSMLEVFPHIWGTYDPVGAEIRPSGSPSAPSVYKVDLHPIRVPFVNANSQTEGVVAAFQAVSRNPNDNGYIAMTECVTSVYPQTNTSTLISPSKVYTTSANDGWDFKEWSDAIWSKDAVIPYPPYTTAPNAVKPVITATNNGLTIDASATPENQIAIARVDFSRARGQNLYNERVRIAPGKVYQVRYRLSSTQASNKQSQIRLRTRSLDYLWCQKVEMGGSWGLYDGNVNNTNNTIAQQILPGTGCSNPEVAASGKWWYTLLMHSPLDPQIRADYPGVPIGDSMSTIFNKPGPGVNLPSIRDLVVGIDVIDSISNSGPNKYLEQTKVTVDRVEVREFNVID